MSAEMCEFYERWGVQLRVSSAHYPQSNGRAEAAVKSAKRTLRDNLAADGDIENDRVSSALSQYLNTPLRDIDRSPAELLMGRQLRGGVPTAKRNLRVSNWWCATLRARERQMAEQCERLEGARRPARSHPPLTAGQRVRVFNEAARRWDRTGVVVEVKEHHQYLVRLDGSGRVSLRTRKHIRAVRSLSDELGDHVPPSPVARAGSTPQRTPPPAPASESLPEVRPGARHRRPPTWLRDYVQ